MNRLFRAVSSLRVGITLLVLLTAASLIGVVIPQELDNERYLHQWGTIGGGLLLGAGFDHLFATLWYNILLGLFALNVLLCTAGRLKATVSAIFATRFLGVSQIEALSHHAAITIGNDKVAAIGKVRALFRRQGFSVVEERQSEGSVLDIRKGRLRDFGSAVLHFSLLPLLLGGLIGKTGGFSYSEMLGEGETVPVRGRSFSVRCDYFSLERNERGQVKDYKSGLTLLDSAGDTLARKVIEVNHPLVYRGVKFYQSSYRNDPASVNSIDVVVGGPLVGPIGKKLVLQPGVPDSVGNTGIVAVAGDFLPDFMFDRKTKQAVNRSDDPNNPAVFVTLTRGGDTLFSRWAFQKFGSMHHAEDDYSVSFLSYDSPMSTGLLIKENPGGGAIWFGIIGMSLGVMLVFWIPRRRYWVALRSGETGASELCIGGIVSRDDPDGTQRFEETVASLRKLLDG